MKKFLMGLGVVLIVLCVIIWAVIRHNPMIWTGLKMGYQAVTASTAPEWKTVDTPEGGLELETPFPISWSPDANKEHAGVGMGIVSGRSQINLSGFTVFVSGTTFSPPRPAGTTDEAQAKLLNYIMEHPVEGMTYRTEPMTCAGLPTTLLHQSGRQTEISEILLSNENASWTIIVGHKDTDEQKTWFQRVVNSIRFKTPTLQP